MKSGATVYEQHVHSCSLDFLFYLFLNFLSFIHFFSYSMSFVLMFTIPFLFKRQIHFFRTQVEVTSCDYRTLSICPFFREKQLILKNLIRTLRLLKPIQYNLNQFQIQHNCIPVFLQQEPLFQHP